jgi:intein/homing endonuclease
MPKEFVMSLDENSIRFTPDGEIVVVDGIRVLSESDTAEEIWKTLKNENPEILSLCKRFYFSKNKPVQVVDSQGWEKIETVLFDYILEKDL